MTRRFIHAAMPALLALAAFSYETSSFADVPPIDSCTPTMSAGTPCTNAGPNGNQPGTCTASKCTKTLPDGDGGFTTMQYDCMLCTTGSAGAGGSGGAGTGGSTAPASSSSDDGGCTLSPGAQRDGALMLSMLALGLGALAFSRRRR